MARRRHLLDRGLNVALVDRAGVEPATFSVRGSCATGLRHRPIDVLVSVVEHRGVEPRDPAISARCRHRLAGALCVVPRALESLPAGFRPAAPPSELQDRASAREPCERRHSGFTEQVKEPSLLATSRQSRRSESNRLPLGYGPSVLPSGPRRRIR